MKTIRFFAQGLPTGQPRPRAFARKVGGKFVARCFDAGTAEAWKGDIALAGCDGLTEDNRDFCRDQSRAALRSLGIAEGRGK